MIYKYFFPSCGLYFPFPDSVFWSINVLHFDDSICLKLSYEPGGRNENGPSPDPSFIPCDPQAILS